jgi:hypothetical protein
VARCTVYGQTVTKLYKTFLATYRPTGGVIRVVIVLEDHDWYPFFSTDPNATPAQIIEAFADLAFGVEFVRKTTIAAVKAKPIDVLVNS